MTLNSRDFERAVEEALQELPPEFASLLENVAVVIEDEPSADDLDEMQIPDDEELLGIYRGVPLPHRSWEAPPELPDQIAIFRGPILRLCDSRDEAVAEIRDTVIHELGHYFGLDDHEMEY